MAGGVAASGSLVDWEADILQSRVNQKWFSVLKAHRDALPPARLHLLNTLQIVPPTGGFG